MDERKTATILPSISAAVRIADGSVYLSYVPMYFVVKSLGRFVVWIDLVLCHLSG